MRDLNRRALLLAGGASCALGVTPGFAGQDPTWENWGGAPYGTSFSDVTSDTKFDFALQELGIPEPLRQPFKDLVRANPTPEPLVYLVPNQVLNGMMSGTDSRHPRPHVMRNVTVGRTVISRGVVRAAEAWEWRLSHEGRLYRLILPKVCFNWSLIIEEEPGEERCVELHFNAFVGGNVRWGVGSLDGALAPSSCNAIRQGDGSWKAWGGECDECVPAVGYISQTLRGTAQVPHRYLYDVTERHQTIRFSTEIWEKTVYICLEDANGRRSCGVYMRPEDWNGRYSADIPDSMWILDEGNCPA
ncbi:hypothetical protein KJ819_00295 [Patescibacteria group bacterium]|nr:hypothetical protein [Patescibacteria group bacterium]MBU1501076.1 hypothetical protein [Patescibacteria group bacterium]MBU2081051.1 hypothetical protein [Patescibacteria group bacterium]MBU2124142.1 hypothetical protein [Patescibacteria group bacterium]MBU2194998.1 hypothetical protein [Patescibacteria group bacterium]